MENRKGWYPLADVVEMRKIVFFCIIVVWIGIALQSIGWGHDIPEQSEDIKEVITDVLKNDNSIGFLSTTFFIAFILGAAHSLTPGHGKAVIAAYMVGTQGTLWDAVLLGIAITLTHVSIVIILGIVLLVTSQQILPSNALPVLSTLSGIIITVVGLWMIYRCLQNSDQDDSNTHHHHHVHHHKVKEKRPSSRWGLISLGISGGMAPCSDAIIVLLVAVALNEVVLGLAIIFVFSLGMAAVLIFLGVLFAKSSHLFHKFASGTRLLKAMPVISATLITCLGGYITVRSVLRLSLQNLP